MKKAMVFGAGISGVGAKKLLEHLNYNVILVDDKLGVSSEDGKKLLGDIELFIKSPGVPYNELVLEAKKNQIKVIDEIELCYEYMVQYDVNSKIVAITGTNGKTTTTTKITELLQYCGYRAEYAGNIGKSFAELLLEKKELDYIVLELSSFQLENLIDFKPFISMVINLTPDHLVRYNSVDEYYDTKFNICKNQGEKEYFILNTDCEEIVKRLDLIPTNKIEISVNSKKDCYVENGKLYWREEEVLETDKLSLKGRHNLENILFIVSTGKLCGVESGRIREFLYHTKTLEHRMEDFYNYGKIKFINDSKATNIDSTSFAVEAYKDCTLICGGYDKKLDWVPLVELIKEHANCVYLIGDIADELNRRLLDIGYSKDKIFLLRELKICLEDMKQRFSKEEERVVLFSPSTSSYDQFKNFEHRGKVFKELVREIFGR